MNMGYFSDMDLELRQLGVNGSQINGDVIDFAVYRDWISEYPVVEFFFSEIDKAEKPVTLELLNKLNK